MNEITHFFFGYLIARVILKKKNNQFEIFFLSMAALIPDFDMVIGFFIPFEHGIFSHTILGGLVFTLVYTSIIWIMGRNFLKELDISFTILFGLATIGMLCHLLLDSFTFYYSYEASNTSHMYFWPIWNFPVHINTMFPSATWEVRVWTEVLFSLFLIVVIIIYGWMIKRENPFLMFFPGEWSQYLDEPKGEYNYRYSIFSIFILNIVILGFLVLNYFI